jgi:hypothetical protein
MTTNHERGTTMSKFTDRRVIAGQVLHISIGGLMIFAGAAKLLGWFPPEALGKLGLGGQLHLIGAGELVTGVLLLVPRTSSLGSLLTSAFWGGAICIHMGHGESYVVPSVLLLLSWLGAYLRLPAMFRSFSQARSAARRPEDLPPLTPPECEACHSGA